MIVVVVLVVVAVSLVVHVHILIKHVLHTISTNNNEDDIRCVLIHYFLFQW
jgi:hypothetical protein